jgi:hypothetical protein
MTRQTFTEQIACNRLTIVLIKPSKYDDEGYVIRHLRGVLPSNVPHVFKRVKAQPRFPVCGIPVGGGEKMVHFGGLDGAGRMVE